MTVVLAVCTGYGQACTNLIVGKKASADGSVIVSYSADDFGSFGYLRHWAAGKHAKGTMRPVYNWENNNYAGEIEEAPETYNVIEYERISVDDYGNDFRWSCRTG